MHFVDNPPFFYKEDNFGDFPFVFLRTDPLKRDLLKMNEFTPKESKFPRLEQTSCQRGLKIILAELSPLTVYYFTFVYPEIWVK